MKLKNDQISNWLTNSSLLEFEQGIVLVSSKRINQQGTHFESPVGFQRYTWAKYLKEPRARSYFHSGSIHKPRGSEFRIF